VILTDTHCHLDLEKFDLDREAALERAAREGVTRILIPGISLPSSRGVVKLAESHSMLYAAVGVHPTEAAAWNESTRDELLALFHSPTGTSAHQGRGAGGEGKIVAIGEIGLDYYWDAAAHGLQKEVLRAQLGLAAETGLPVLLHMREARDASGEQCAGELLQILEEWCAGLRAGKNPLAERPGVLHSFSGSLETARTALRLGFYIGVTGPVTFENARARQAIIAALPLECILIETDAPFLAPHPFRGKRNEPAYVRLIADKIALLHACASEEVATITSANAGKLFAWKETA
jgi:TatD DNase family protein